MVSNSPAAFSIPDGDTVFGTDAASLFFDFHKNGLVVKGGACSGEKGEPSQPDRTVHEMPTKAGVRRPDGSELMSCVGCLLLRIL